MSFVDSQFILFIIILLIPFMFFVNKFKKYNVFLLIISFCYLFFFGWKNAVILTVFSLVNFLLISSIKNVQNQRIRTHLLKSVIILNLIVFIIFRFYGIRLHVVGFSFLVLKTVFVAFEVAKKGKKTSFNFLNFLNYLFFFPQIASGPISPPSELMDQINDKPVISSEKISSGIWRVFLGVFKKLILANQLSFFLVDPVFKNPHLYSTFNLVLAVFGYTFLLYFDFSGYCDISIGLSRMMGFEIGENFDLPLLSKNIQEFWSRWNITYSNWLNRFIFQTISVLFSDFLSPNLVVIFSLLATMIASGLWHGFTWNFLAWGLINGCLLSAFYLFNERANKNLIYFFGYILNFSIISLVFLFFKLNSLNEVGTYLNAILTHSNKAVVLYKLDSLGYWYFFLGIIYHVLGYNKYFIKWDSRSRKMSRIDFAFICVMILVLIRVFGNVENPFIYYKF